MNKVVVVFELTSTGAALTFFSTAVAAHLGTCWEFTHTEFMHSGLMLLVMVAVYRGEYSPVYIIESVVRLVVVFGVVLLESW